MIELLDELINIGMNTIKNIFGNQEKATLKDHQKLIYLNK
jgi:hypothetical protein